MLKDDQAGALDKLERAIHLAEPGGFMRTFVDLGPPMANLLIQLGQQGVSQDYVAQILKAFPQAQPPPLPAAQSQLIEPLTKRELEGASAAGVCSSATRRSPFSW